MYDTFPDDTMMMAQTGVEIGFLTTLDLLDEMQAVSDAETDELYRDITSRCEVLEPTEEEVRLSCRQAIGLRRLVEKRAVDALAIEIAPEIMVRTGMLPSLGMALLIDHGTVVATEGDLSVSVGGLMLKSLAGKPVHFWEHLMFDEEKNQVLGGHEGGSAGFSMARKDRRPKLRSTQYVDFRHTPGTSLNGVLPEFITQPGPVTIVNLFRGTEGYEMRIATGRSVDTSPRPVHFEHTIVEPDAPLRDYFARMKEVGVCHHFGLVHAEVAGELHKVADMLNMKCERLTVPTPDHARP
jgi:L-fucose isomerase-like protein